MRRFPLAPVLLTAWVATAWALPGGGMLGAWAVFPLLGVIPGLVLARLVPLEAGALARWALGLTAAPLASTVAAWGLMAAGLPLPLAARAVALVAWALWVGLEVRAARRPADAGEPVPRFVWAWALGGALVIALVMCTHAWLRVRGDAWVHGGIVWEILERGIPPQDPRFAGLTLNYVWFYNYLIALLTTLRAGDPFALMAVSNSVSMFATLALAALLGRALWKDARVMAGAAVLLGLGYNAGMWLLWPGRLAPAWLGHDRGPARLAKELAQIHWDDTQVIFALNAPYSYMASFLDKFLHGTALNLAYLMMLLYLWALLHALEGARWRAWAWSAAAAAGMLLFHGVVGLSVVPVALAALGVAWGLAGRWPWLPSRGRLVAAAAATAVGAVLAAPYTRSISQGWSASRSGLHHSYLQLDPFMWWTILTALAVALWFARRSPSRLVAERRGPAVVVALFAAGTIAFACVVTLPIWNHVKFVFEAFAALVALGAAGFRDELAAWRRRLGRWGAGAVFALVLCAPAVLTVRGYLMDRSGDVAPELHPAPGEDALYAWMRTSLPARAVVVDHRFRALVMVQARRQLLLGDFSGPERAAYPLDQVLERRAVMHDLYGHADSVERDVAVLARLARPAYVLVRGSDFAPPDSVAPPLDRRPDLFERVYDRDGFIVYHVRSDAPVEGAPTGGSRP